MGIVALIVDYVIPDPLYAKKTTSGRMLGMCYIICMCVGGSIIFDDYI
jgi:hypothetical protein